MMQGFKLLIDTNVVIGLEDAQPVRDSWADLVRLSAAHNVSLFVDDANYDDVDRDKDRGRRAVTHSKLNKFQKLRGLPIPSVGELSRRFGAILNEHDESDVRLLLALDAKAVNFLITEDVGLHRRAHKVGLAASVLRVEDAVEWLKTTFSEKVIALPDIEEKKAYEIDRTDKIFVSLEDDYPLFSEWFDKCCREHRDCWVLRVDSQIAGIVVRKDENREEAPTLHAGPKILKVCTFKVSDEFRGEKLGELLLKQILWFAQSNKYDLVYLTVFPKHDFLVDLLSYYGFKVTTTLGNGEFVMEKPITHGAFESIVEDFFEFDRLHYPRFYDGPEVEKYIVPIKSSYHKILFPEVESDPPLPLFPREGFGPLPNPRRLKIPGNTIRKVYLCRAQANSISPGDLIFFYVSKNETQTTSQSVVTVGVVEKMFKAKSADDLVRLTAKRSAFSSEDLSKWQASPVYPVKVIDFLLVGHVESFINLPILLSERILQGHPPQSITRFDDRYAALKPYLKLGFDL